MLNNKNKNFIKSIISLLFRNWVLFVIMILSGLISMIFVVIGPYFIAKAIDLMLKSIEENNMFFYYNDLINYFIICVVVYILSFFFSYLQEFISVTYAQKIAYSLRKELSKKLSKLTFSYYEDNPAGDILSRFTNDVDVISSNLPNVVVIFVTSTISMIIVAIIMLSLNLFLGSIICIIVPISGFAIFIIVKISQKYFNEQQELLGVVDSDIEQGYTGHEVFKSFNASKNLLNNFYKHNDRLFYVGYKSMFLSRAIFPIIVVTSILCYTLVVTIGCYLTVLDVFTIGFIQAFIQYVNQFTKPLNQLSQVMNLIQQIIASSRRIFTFLDEKEEGDLDEKSKLVALDLNKKYNNNSIEKKYEQDTICFENVCFGYNNKMVLENFNLHIKKGKKIAIIGQTGSGKTTILKLLMRFYDVNSGRITFGGKDIRLIDKTKLRNKIGIVMQDVWLFKGTIFENVTFGNSDVDIQSVISAAKHIGAHDFINRLPDKYNFNIDENVNNLSYGQLQLISILRTFIANREVLIFDEATSSVDVELENVITKAIEKLFIDKTVLIIAHRLSTIRNADLIVFLKDGKIIEQGTHEDLYKLNGTYTNMFDSQFKIDG